MSTIKFEIENKDHDVTMLIGKNSIFTFNPNTRNGEELSDFLSGCEEVPDNETDLRKENEEIKSMLEKLYKTIDWSYDEWNSNLGHIIENEIKQILNTTI